jgi:hypothetical protein
VACVLFAARPFLARYEADAAAVEPSAAESERACLLAERDRALAALKELEFDRRTGKVSEDDYAELVRELRREAAEILRALESRAPAGPDPEPAREVDVHA